MLYQMYESLQATAVPAHGYAVMARQCLEHPFNPWRNSFPGRHLASGLKFIEFMTGPNSKPEFGIDAIEIDGKEHRVVTSVVSHTPFCELRKFSLDLASVNALPQPRLPVLLVAPMSGHHATLLRDTIKRLLTDCDVYVTDWVDARDIPFELGSFGLDSYIAHVRDFLVELHDANGSVHVVAVCQPGPAVLTAVSVLAQANAPQAPASMTLMGSPIDPRRSPTAPNNFARNHSLAWFNHNMICTVPMMFEGAGRRVYPGFLQLAGFINMNPTRHQNAYMKYYQDLVSGNDDAVEAHEFFYSEYNAVMDMPADFYLQTIDRVFHQAAIATGNMTFRHRRIDPAAITRTALLTIEGEKDDISGVGQTEAAQELCTGIPKSKRKHLLKDGVGHYGVFSGRRWREEIAPFLITFMRKHG
ncbi:MAG: polyhydroxyalkanoate depolymerase [Pseudomonadota bacterium]